MKPRGPLRLFRAVGLSSLAFLVAGSLLLSCGRSPLDDSVDSIDVTGSAGAGGRAGAAGATGATGGGGFSAADLEALCQRACDKLISCVPVALTEDACVGQCTAGGMQSCANFAEVFSQTDKCVAGTTCVDFLSCLQNVPACLNSSGAPGATGAPRAPGAPRPTGAAAAAGAAGAAGADTCASVCSRAATCCRALAPTDDCAAFSRTCAPGSDLSADKMACQSVLTASAEIPSIAAACR